jgi:hypothetical protein
MPAKTSLSTLDDFGAMERLPFGLEYIRNYTQIGFTLFRRRVFRFLFLASQLPYGAQLSFERGFNRIENNLTHIIGHASKKIKTSVRASITIIKTYAFYSEKWPNSRAALSGTP